MLSLMILLQLLQILYGKMLYLFETKLQTIPPGSSVCTRWQKKFHRKRWRRSW